MAQPGRYLGQMPAADHSRVLFLIWIAVVVVLAAMVIPRGEPGVDTSAASTGYASAFAAPAENPGPVADSNQTDSDAQLVADTPESAIESDKPAVFSKPVAVRETGGVPGNSLTAAIPSTRSIYRTPGGSESIGKLTAKSPYLKSPTYVWLLEQSDDGAWGKIVVPFDGSGTRTGWISLQGASMGETDVQIRVDLSDRLLKVYRGGTVRWTAPVAVGATGSPTPTGRYWVTDRVPVSGANSPFGHYAFGISGTQPNLPSGWTGGDQLAIHGTNAPGSIGYARSAGCLRASADTLERLKPLLALGTPIVIHE